MRKVEHVFAFLDTEVRLHTDCSEMAGRLGELTTSARHSVPVSELIQIEILREGPGYLFRENGRSRFCSLDQEWLALLSYSRAIKGALQRRRTSLLLHAASGTFHSRRFLISGPKGAGKTTLILSLMYRGAEAHGDDLVLLDKGGMTTLPRKFHVKLGTATWVPELSRFEQGRKTYPTIANRFFFFDPTEAGMDWAVCSGQVDFIFFAVPNHFRETRTEACPKYLMAHKLVGQILNYSSRANSNLEHLWAAVNGARCYDLLLGDPGAAAARIENLLLREESV